MGNSVCVFGKLEGKKYLSRDIRRKKSVDNLKANCKYHSLFSYFSCVVFFYEFNKYVADNIFSEIWFHSDVEINDLNIYLNVIIFENMMKWNIQNE